MDPDLRIALLEDRLVRLEQRNRLLTLLLFLPMALVAIAAAKKELPDVNADVVSARTFQLVDEKHKILGSWGQKEGRPVLVFNGRHSSYAPLMLQETADGAYLSLHSTEKASIDLSVRPKNGGASFSMYGGSQGAIATSFNLRTDDKASLDIRSSSADLLKLNNGALSLYDAKLSLRDASGNVIKELP